MSSNEQTTTCKLSCSSHSLFVVLNEAAAGGIDDRLLRKQLEVACHQLAISRPQLGQVQAALRCTDSDPGSGPMFYLPKKFRIMLSSSYASLKPWRGPAAASCMPLTDLPRKWEAADSVLYTDGSATPQTAAGRTDGHSIGAGVYCKDLGGRQVECRIDPAGQGATNTITRAELVAILQALQEVNGQPCVIATDSKASMHMIQNQLFNPSKLRNSPHSRLLSAIGNVLRDRARAKVHTTIVKVKSHIGVHGNEMADKLANAARESADVTISVGISVGSCPPLLAPLCLHH